MELDQGTTHAESCAWTILRLNYSICQQALGNVYLAVCQFNGGTSFYPPEASGSSYAIRTFPLALLSHWPRSNFGNQTNAPVTQSRFQIALCYDSLPATVST